MSQRFIGKIVLQHGRDDSKVDTNLLVMVWKLLWFTIFGFGMHHLASP